MDRSAFLWDDFAWTTHIPLPPEPAAPRQAPSHTQVRVPVCFAPEGREDQPLDDSEIAAVARAVANLPRLFTALLPHLLTYCETLRAHPEAHDLAPDDLPAVDTPAAMTALIEVENIYVHQVSQDGIPYAGIEFSYPWEEEHGLGVLMHDTRIVELGGADSALLLWIAKEDARQAPA
ncbi:DUF6985 domain-containing protein [Streptomyces sp. CMB-StM0423]|uniref:DUF6985 domain-containing protein n=1 Tax=Streptomyces sp. CMB-StM0423 TaxID=2059884 RepID=UPI000C704A7B|nr:hypothetical protein [Streptomyces sp. CMB-StM0423]AUH42256.1 hypothetical protein CXR04_20505 [Streptomyces sp. CMB-StM0423]